MNQNQQNIEINGKVYNFNVEQAVKLGVLIELRPAIKQFSVGDLFRYGGDPTRTDLLALVVKVNEHHVLLGAGYNSLTCWSPMGYNTKLSYSEMLEMLNTLPFYYIKNITTGFTHLLTQEAKKSKMKLLEQKPAV